jgi:hypothetical protein
MRVIYSHNKDFKDSIIGAGITVQRMSPRKEIEKVTMHHSNVKNQEFAKMIKTEYPNMQSVRDL